MLVSHTYPTSYRAPISVSGANVTDTVPHASPPTATARSDDAVLKLFNDKELSGNVVKLKSAASSSGVARKGANNKKSANWKERARQLENQGSPFTTIPFPTYLFDPLTSLVYNR